MNIVHRPVYIEDFRDAFKSISKSKGCYQDHEAFNTSLSDLAKNGSSQVIIPRNTMDCEYIIQK